MSDGGLILCPMMSYFRREIETKAQCEGGVMNSTTSFQDVGGGVIPAPSLHFHTKQYDDAFSLIKKFHYSHRLPSNIQFVGTLHIEGGLFGDLGQAVGAAIFSIPPTRWSENVLELSRLVRHDNFKFPLTLLLSFSCKYLKKKGFDLLVSFADSTFGHHGGIYQAANWNYHGKRDCRMDGLIINDKFVPGRSCNSIYGTRSPGKLKTLKPEFDIKPHYDSGKFLYWKALNISGMQKAKKLNLVHTKYPKNSG